MASHIWMKIWRKPQVQSHQRKSDYAFLDKFKIVSTINCPTRATTIKPINYAFVEKQYSIGKVSETQTSAWILTKDVVKLKHMQMPLELGYKGSDSSVFSVIVIDLIYEFTGVILMQLDGDAKLPNILFTGSYELTVCLYFKWNCILAYVYCTNKLWLLGRLVVVFLFHHLRQCNISDLKLKFQDSGIWNAKIMKFGFIQIKPNVKRLINMDTSKDGMN